VEDAESVTTSAVAYPEARSAFARLERDGHLSPEEHRTIIADLDGEWPSYEVVDVTREVAGVAGALAARHQRHRLVSGLSKDENRHMILVTATPHSGKEDAFRSLLESR
jgi:hypothetical protein